MCEGFSGQFRYKIALYNLDYSYTILGTEFISAEPQIWYPGGERTKHIVVQLTLSAKDNMYDACYEMAHETIHLLAPTGGKNSNNLEEGVATYFANLWKKH